MHYEYAPDPYARADLQEAECAAVCALCGDELPYGRCCYLLETSPVCEACLGDYARAYFRTRRVCLRRGEEA